MAELPDVSGRAGTYSSVLAAGPPGAAQRALGLDDALDARERRMFFASFYQRCAELRGDAPVWAEIQADREREAIALSDGER